MKFTENIVLVPQAWNILRSMVEVLLYFSLNTHVIKYRLNVGESNIKISRKSCLLSDIEIVESTNSQQ